ncbi:hypothetical protein C5167_025977 [Papaver somniferum]|uniref:Uncharacterized protein n=1 Tax=Papaver somniferum TaxID=3469 RepID=A0A4Y7JUG3_PAPSO|nr:hypothetical protein C5167_025977 [Papaver somniferum]
MVVFSYLRGHPRALQEHKGAVKSPRTTRSHSLQGYNKGELGASWSINMHPKFPILSEGKSIWSKKSSYKNSGLLFGYCLAERIEKKYDLEAIFSSD